jgi:type VI secretion system protein ImpM
LDGLAVPRTLSRAASARNIVPLGDDMAAMVTGGADFTTPMSALRAARPEVYAAASFWWTAGGGDFPALALSCRGLPDPYRYSTLLTGDPGSAGEGK